MKWRTDKPTADVIVAYVRALSHLNESISPCILYKVVPTGSYIDSYCRDIPFTHIVKWADLEEDNYKTTYPNTDFDKKVAEFKQRLINKKAITNYEDADPFVGIYWTQLLEIMHSFGQWGLDQFNYSKDETVTDCHQLEEEIDSEWAKCKPVDEGMGLESAIIVNEQFDDIARHFAKWGAEHFCKATKNIEEKEIELDEEITKYWKDISSIYGAVGKEITRFDFDDACKYFYELGKNGR